jgi:hypothetical protein
MTCGNYCRLIFWACCFDARSWNCEQRRLALSCLSVRLHVRMEQRSSHWTDFHKIWYLSIFLKSVEKAQISLRSDKNNGYFTWRRVYIYDISGSVLFKMRSVSDNIGRENQNTHLILNDFFPKIVHVWDNVEEYCKAGQPTYDNIIRRMRMTYWITKATNTHSECVILMSFVL